MAGISGLAVRTGVAPWRLGPEGQGWRRERTQEKKLQLELNHAHGFEGPGRVVSHADGLVAKVPAACLVDRTSVASSIFHYRHENGRTYHAYRNTHLSMDYRTLLIPVGDGQYWGPNDEQARSLDVISHLAPGGYIEQAEINPAAKSDDGSVTPGDLYDQCGKLAVTAGNAFGKSLMIEETMQDDIARAGFTDVVKVKYKWPVGAWSNDQRLKELGRWNLVHWNQGMEGWTMRFLTKHLGWTYDAVKKWNECGICTETLTLATHFYLID
ncbi:MAG: hypothetical protein Q9186_003672 [Xanthomendoza sp. 1 TL-2023]